VKFKLIDLGIAMVYIGVDIGATWVRCAVADTNGKIIAKKKIRTLPDYGDKNVMLLRLESTIRSLLKNLDAKSVEAIGVGSIGPLDMRRGIILRTPNLPIENIPVGEYLKKEFNVPVYIVNDCTAAVIGERFFGAGKNTENIVYITLSSGIGGGAIVDGNVLFGKDGNAVEIGHIVVDYDRKLRCGCGGYGHWEAYTSGKNIGIFTRFLVENVYGRDKYDVSILSRYSKDPSNIKYPDIVTAAKENDTLALQIIEEIAEINAAGFATVTNVYDPEIISVGGSIALKNPSELILKPIGDKIEEFLINRKPKILITPLGEDVVIMGAVALAMNPDIIPKKFRD